ncbi:MAG: type II secretion system F family protein, partial [Armatimonadota bacterium]
ICISIITVLVMVTFILPRFMLLFERMEAKLPWTTKALMDFSNNLTHYWYIYLIAVIGLVVAFKKYSSSAQGKKTIDGLLLKLPVVGEIVKKVVLSRVLASMSTLLKCGVPMLQTLQTSASAANNEIVKEALLKASTDVSQGTSTSQSLRETNVFPPIVIQMVESGEKTGELPSMLEYIQGMFSRETDAKIKSITSVIEPIMIVVLGLIVGFIAISVIVPIYSLVGGVK